MGRRANRVGVCLALNCLAGGVRIDVHHIMWIDQIHGHEPWLTLLLQFARLGSQPGNGRRRRKAIIPVSTNRAVNKVTKSEEIRETVAFDHLTILEQWCIDRLVCRVESTAEVPL